MRRAVISCTTVVGTGDRLVMYNVYNIFLRGQQMTGNPNTNPFSHNGTESPPWLSFFLTRGKVLLCDEFAQSSRESEPLQCYPGLCTESYMHIPCNRGKA